MTNKRSVLSILSSILCFHYVLSSSLLYGDLKLEEDDTEFINKIQEEPKTNIKDRKNKHRKSEDNFNDIEITLNGKSPVSMSSDCVNDINDILRSCEKKARHVFVASPSLELITKITRYLHAIIGIGIDYNVNKIYHVPQFTQAELKKKSLAGLRSVDCFDMRHVSFNAYIGATFMVNKRVSFSTACVFELHKFGYDTLYKRILDFGQNKDPDEKEKPNIIYCKNLGFFIRVDYHIVGNISAFMCGRCCWLLDNTDSRECHKHMNFLFGAGASMKIKMRDRISIGGNLMASYKLIAFNAKK